MGKVDRLRNIVEPFAGIILGLPTPDPARRTGITPLPYTKHVLMYMVTIVGSILNENALPPPPPFSYLGMFFIYFLYLI